MIALTLGETIIGSGHPTFVIAEIGVNHDGDVHRALDLVGIAADCGADAIKLQIFKAATLMHCSSQLADYQKRRVEDATPEQMLRRYELPPDAVHQIVAKARRLGLVPLATPFSPDDLELVEQLALPAVKIASPDLVNRPLLMKSAKLDVPLLISTGASTEAEIDRTVSWMTEWQCSFALLHCISSYPTSPADAHLRWISRLAARHQVPIGYSDHAETLHSGMLAVAAGACLVERHLTHDRTAAGPDHAASSDPAQFLQYVKLIREAEVLLGTDLPRQVLEAERDVRRLSRQSLVARRPLMAGALVQREDLTVQRPGTGMLASEIDQAVGSRLNRSISAGQMLQQEMLQRGN